MSTDMSIISLFLNASLVVQFVMLLLLLASLASWFLIFKKAIVMKDARRAADEFEDRFWSGSDLADLYDKITSRRNAITGMSRIFEAGFKEFARQRKNVGIDPMAVVEGSERAMRVALNREIDELESSLSFLATTGSTSPYVGLFGTVWGIMNSFRALANVNQATLAMVAPGIAEALVATAMGLFAAIPAVIAYNRFQADLEHLVNRYDAFADEFSTILQRHAHSEVSPRQPDPMDENMSEAMS
ncbi:MAG: protein TolQ [Gammaproteobacteria bacterium]|nr:MAG: protein TolQ [Gammaproteobacteria bacterium]